MPLRKRPSQNEHRRLSNAVSRSIWTPIGPSSRGEYVKAAPTGTLFLQYQEQGGSDTCASETYTLNVQSRSSEIAWLEEAVEPAAELEECSPRVDIVLALDSSGSMKWGDPCVGPCNAASRTVPDMKEFAKGAPLPPLCPAASCPLISSRVPDARGLASNVSRCDGAARCSLQV